MAKRILSPRQQCQICCAYLNYSQVHESIYNTVKASAKLKPWDLTDGTCVIATHSSKLGSTVDHLKIHIRI